MKKYLVVFGKTEGKTVFYKVLDHADSIQEALEKRKISGDIVIFNDGKLIGEHYRVPKVNIPQTYMWLFEWEKRDKNCYARRCLKRNTII